MAAAFATYLGPYKHSFRRIMLTVYWPECLQERGVPLLLDDAPHTVADTDSKEDLTEEKSQVFVDPVFMPKICVSETQWVWSNDILSI